MFNFFIFVWCHRVFREVNQLLLGLSCKSFRSLSQKPFWVHANWCPLVATLFIFIVKQPNSFFYKNTRLSETHYSLVPRYSRTGTLKHDHKSIRLIQWSIRSEPKNNNNKNKYKLRLTLDGRGRWANWCRWPLSGIWLGLVLLRMS